MCSTPIRTEEYAVFRGFMDGVLNVKLKDKYIPYRFREIYEEAWKLGRKHAKDVVVELKSINGNGTVYVCKLCVLEKPRRNGILTRILRNGIISPKKTGRYRAIFRTTKRRGLREHILMRHRNIIAWYFLTSKLRAIYYGNGEEL